MCSPIALAVGSVVTGFAGAAAKASAQSQAIQASNNAKEYNARIAELNAARAEKQMLDAKKRGYEDAKTNDRKVDQLIGDHTVTLTNSGVELTGTAATILSQDARGKLEDHYQILENADKEVEDYDIQRLNYLNSARLERSSMQSTSSASIFGDLTNIGMGALSFFA